MHTGAVASVFAADRAASQAALDSTPSQTFWYHYMPPPNAYHVYHGSTAAEGSQSGSFHRFSSQHMDESAGPSTTPHPGPPTVPLPPNSPLPHSARRDASLEAAIPGTRPRKRQRTVPNKENVPLAGLGPASEAALPTATHPALTRPAARDLSSVQATPSHEQSNTQVPPPRAFGSVISAPMNSRRASRAVATDVWFFLRPLTLDPDPKRARVAPDPFPQYDTNEKVWMKQPPVSAGNYLGCKLCAEKGKWYVWKNAGGQTVAVRNHLINDHLHQFRVMVAENGLKNAKIIVLGLRAQTMHPSAREPYSSEGMEDLLVQYVVCCDEPISLVDNPFFRRLIEFCIGDKLDEGEELIHCTAFTELIIRKFSERHQRLVNLLKTSLGHVSFTADMWSNAVLRGFLAVTLHFIRRDPVSGRLVYHAELGAFRYVRGRHTGAAMAETFKQILMELDILGKVGHITLDNASNCDKMVEELEGLLAAEGITFSAAENRIRCFPHVINIAVDHGLAALTKVDELRHFLETSGPLSDVDRQYIDVLGQDLIKRCRELVNTCRSSGLRREELRTCIVQANNNKAFGCTGSGEAIEVDPAKQLLRDMDPRWSSRLLMIDRVEELYPAIHLFLLQLSEQIRNEVALSNFQLMVLQDIRTFLVIPHATQELLSAEHTPTICHVLPSYDDLIESLDYAAQAMRPLSYAIMQTRNKLVEYQNLSRRSRTYAIAMIINPAVRLEGIKRSWSHEEYMMAKSHMREAIISHRRAMRQAARTSPNAPMTHTMGSHSASDTTPPLSSSGPSLTLPHAARASLALHSGTSRLAAIKNMLAAKVKGTSNPTNGAITTPSPEELERREREQDERAADAELEVWEGMWEGMTFSPPANSNGHIDLLQLWAENEEKLPLMFRVSMDILPIQASSVACERVFSSGKETDTMRRRRLSPIMMEVLQFLKQSWKRKLLDFSSRPDLASEQDCLKRRKVAEKPSFTVVSTATDMHNLLVTAQNEPHALQPSLQAAFADEQRAVDDDDVPSDDEYNATPSWLYD